MKRLHVHVAVKDLETSIRFDSQLFAAERETAAPAACCAPSCCVPKTV